MTDLPVLHEREEPVAKAGGVVPTHREVCPNQFAPGRGDGNAGRQCFDRCNHSPARPVHGTAAGRSATLGECRKEASSWLNAAYQSYGQDTYLRARNPGFEPVWVFLDAQPHPDLAVALKARNIRTIIYQSGSGSVTEPQR